LRGTRTHFPHSDDEERRNRGGGDGNGEGLKERMARAHGLEWGYCEVLPERFNLL
jgi:hypothetical protein